ncbi:aldehyde dehydrogenase family protein [Candidatus Haliotispira prima]|uniref:Aldehyde dehydrogenase family protein n=1 Tax=Candidatus Haliotispira prima TaxID=3034016 RepID=A0ABY8MEB5_9SPIO|nr:aldehyde dehydrogenase family protein [Candidatus Haliotispira prima]
MLEVNAPYDRSVITQLPTSDKASLEKAISTAHAYFKNQKQWLPVYKRIEILEKIAVIMEERTEKLITDAAREGGKPYTDSKVEVLRAINGVKLAVQCLSGFHGEEIPMGLTKASEGRMAFTRREPIGVVASVSAFNHPVNLIIHQTVPAIAVGAPFIVKPASATPISCLNLMEIFREAGLPEEVGVAHLCDRDSAGFLVTDPRINYLSFIGSGEVGWKLRSQVAPGTRCGLEHGGVAPVIVFDDADIDAMIPQLVKGGFYHAGQVCVSVQCVFAPKGNARDIADRIAEKAKNLVVGDPLDPKTEVGPIITDWELNRVGEWVQEAVKDGAQLLCGGENHSATCYKPTVLFNPPKNAKVTQHEIFGPVVCVYGYEHPDEALEIINNMPYGFQSALYTQNIDKAFSYGKQLNATAVMINDHTAFRVDWMPFGGRDQSGLGLGGIPYSMHEMSREKMFVFKTPAS